MPRRPTGKRVPRDDGSFIVVNKAANRAGSVFHIPERRTTLPNGRARVKRAHWRATYRDPMSGQQRMVYAPTRDEVTRRRDRAIADGTSPALRSTRIGGRSTTSAFADWWTTTHAARLRRSSVEKYRERLDRLGPLADVPIGDVTPAQVADWQTWLLTTPRSNGRCLAPTTVADTRSTLRQMFSTAVDLEMIRANPVDRVKPPKVNRSPGRVLTRDEVVRLIAEVDHHRYAAAVAVMFTVGLRVSEVLGLAWCDIDLGAGTAHVRRAVVTGEDGRRFGPTKTEGATGVHHLAEGTVERLRAWKAQQAEERLLAGPLWRTHTYESQPLDPVFTKEDGGLVARQQIDKLLRRAAEKVGIDATRLGTHVGRRTVITTLYTAGTDIGDIARHVGHASPATTSRYVASLGERPLKTAQLAAALLDTPMPDKAPLGAAAEPSKRFNKPRSPATRRTPRAERS
jgi:integrase